MFSRASTGLPGLRNKRRPIMSQSMMPYPKCPLRRSMRQVIVSITHQKHLINHTIALILETHAIATKSIETMGNHKTYRCAPGKPKCCYCKGKHLIKKCKMVKQGKGKGKYKLKTASIAQKYKDKIIQKAKEDNISINEATFSGNQQESTYSIEQVEQLLGNMHFSNSGSESE